MVSLALNWSPPDSAPLFDTPTDFPPSANGATTTGQPSSPATPKVTPVPAPSVSPIGKADSGTSSSASTSTGTNVTARSTPPSVAGSSSGSETTPRSMSERHGPATTGKPGGAGDADTGESKPSQSQSQSQQQQYQQQQRQPLQQRRDRSNSEAPTSSAATPSPGGGGPVEVPYRSPSVPPSAVHQPSFFVPTSQPPLPNHQFGYRQQPPNMFYPPAPPPHSQFAWAAYQQMLAAQAQQFYGHQPQNDFGPQQHHHGPGGSAITAGPDGRRRSTSGPQRPPPLLYNDSFHQQLGYPMPYGSLPRMPALPHPMMYAPPHPGSPAGGARPHHISHSQTVPDLGGGFHPHRRGPHPAGLPQKSSSEAGTVPPSRPLDWGGHFKVQFGQAYPPPAYPTQQQASPRLSPSAPASGADERRPRASSHSASHDRRRSPNTAAGPERGPPPSAYTGVSAAAQPSRSSPSSVALKVCNTTASSSGPTSPQVRSPAASSRSSPASHSSTPSVSSAAGVPLPASRPQSPQRSYSDNSQRSSATITRPSSPSLRASMPTSPTPPRPGGHSRHGSTTSVQSSSASKPPGSHAQPALSSPVSPTSPSSSQPQQQQQRDGPGVRRPSLTGPAAGGNTKKPSPLSQQHRAATPSVASTGDDETATQASYGGSDRTSIDRPVSPTTAAAATAAGKATKQTGLTGRLRKALAFGSGEQETAPAPAPAVGQQHHSRQGSTTTAAAARTLAISAPAASAPAPLRQHQQNAAAQPASTDTKASSGSTRSTSPPSTPDLGPSGYPGAMSSGASISSTRGGGPVGDDADSTRGATGAGAASGGKRRGLFNRKFNSSTDNLSISSKLSTVSSASVMLRKIGNVGKIARRHSLMGLTNMFKDKDKRKEGKEGIHDDDFGVLPEFSAVQQQQQQQQQDGTGGGKKGKKAKVGKKAGLAKASVTHATVELESGSSGLELIEGMTPAASYVRQHQLQMQRQAEEEAEARGQEAAKVKTTDDVAENRTRLLEKEKERLKSRRGWKMRFGGGGRAEASGAVDGQPGPEPPASGTPARGDDAGAGGEDDFGGNLSGAVAARLAASGVVGPQDSLVARGGAYAGPRSLSGYGAGREEDDDDEDDEEEEDEEEEEEEELRPPHAAFASRGGDEEYDSEGETSSLKHWGEGIDRAREASKRCGPPRGILKNAGLYSQEEFSQHINRPFAGRPRSNSYDVPNQPNAGASAPPLSHMSTSTDQLDGLSRPSSPQTAHAPLRDAESTRNAGAGGQPEPPYRHHSNSSAPTLTLMSDVSSAPQQQRGPPAAKKQLTFAGTHIYHSTWPAHVYDRRGELATANRLTPLLAQAIKEELNTYKMEEMVVAPSSRVYTHFFV